MRKSSFVFGLYLTVASCTQLMAQQKQEVLIPDSVSESHNSVLAIPYAFYSPETHWGFGVSAGYYFSKEESRRISNIQGSAIYTQDNQFKLSVTPKVFSEDKRSFYSGKFEVQNFPDKFYGIGRDADSVQNFTWRNLSFLFQRQKVVFSDLMIGYQVQLDYGKMKDPIPESRYPEQELYGNGEFFTSALGALITWDSRDNMFYARTGSFYKVSLLSNSKVFLSEYNYTRVIADFREFGAISRITSMGFQFYGDFTWGDVPFQRLPMEGGSEILRGVRQGRYRDKMMMAAQLEFRLTITRKLFATAFVAAADVAPVTNEFALKEYTPSFGGGLRYKLNRAGVNLRFDTAITPGGKPLFYFTAMEAF
ncbi:BamA/TamA family outer membrane protein [Williamwhitmania taraxaci]|uniref:Surface antigen n=1 Tax=Williamwhitmania taraxaci TaxID=1640674 RepID=A0A1G6KZF9_9BACT|nr:BamA/TamA family outer membrane protein [Williamwhitmania taraxaci]SDC36492.1 Surface antigen [Williamwhitmania taraxaci]